ncbi:hypothetical protein AAF712_002566 [Marasmius tenuissimus]|uniref:Chromo domain-containing protein n=1 Tax=Marasmius tenuissimus TaxID=585030 RepID=A0ABR3AA34_9AGAR
MYYTRSAAKNPTLATPTSSTLHVSSHRTHNGGEEDGDEHAPEKDEDDEIIADDEDACEREIEVDEDETENEEGHNDKVKGDRVEEDDDEQQSILGERDEEDNKEDGDADIFEVERILEHEPAVHPTHYYVKWKYYNDDDSCTWEPVDNL